MELTTEEKLLALRLGFDEAVLRIVKSELQKPLEPFKKYISPDDGSEYILSSEDVGLFVSKSLVVELADKYAGMWNPNYVELIHRIRSIIAPFGYLAFLVEPFGHPSLAVMNTLDQYEIIRVMETRGWDFDFDDKQWLAEDLIEKLRQWEQFCKFNVIGAGNDNIKLEFETLPLDLIAFAEQINHLCWEIDQIYGIDSYCREPLEIKRSAEQLARIMRETHTVYLWWD